MNCATTSEPTEMQFGIVDWVGPRNHALDRSPDTPEKGAIGGGDVPSDVAFVKIV